MDKSPYDFSTQFTLFCFLPIDSLSDALGIWWEASLVQCQSLREWLESRISVAKLLVLKVVWKTLVFLAGVTKPHCQCSSCHSPIHHLWSETCPGGRPVTICSSHSSELYWFSPSVWGALMAPFLFSCTAPFSFPPPLKMGYLPVHVTTSFRKVAPLP